MERDCIECVNEAQMKAQHCILIRLVGWMTSTKTDRGRELLYNVWQILKTMHWNKWHLMWLGSILFLFSKTNRVNVTSGSLTVMLEQTMWLIFYIILFFCSSSKMIFLIIYKVLNTVDGFQWMLISAVAYYIPLKDSHIGCWVCLQQADQEVVQTP